MSGIVNEQARSYGQWKETTWNYMRALSDKDINEARENFARQCKLSNPKEITLGCECIFDEEDEDYLTCFWVTFSRMVETEKGSGKFHSVQCGKIKYEIPDDRKEKIANMRNEKIAELKRKKAEFYAEETQKILSGGGAIYKYDEEVKSYIRTDINGSMITS